jgi:hypothetical protein
MRFSAEPRWRASPRVLSDQHVRQTRSAPSPFTGEGWGGGHTQARIFICAPSLSLPRMRGGNTTEREGSGGRVSAGDRHRRVLSSIGRTARAASLRKFHKMPVMMSAAPAKTKTSSRSP